MEWYKFINYIIYKYQNLMCRLKYMMGWYKINYLHVYMMEWFIFCFCLFDLTLYVPSTIFQLNRGGSSWIEPVLTEEMIYVHYSFIHIHDEILLCKMSFFNIISQQFEKRNNKQ